MSADFFAIFMFVAVFEVSLSWIRWYQSFSTGFTKSICKDRNFDLKIVGFVFIFVRKYRIQVCGESDLKRDLDAMKSTAKKLMGRYLVKIVNKWLSLCFKIGKLG